MTMTHTPGEWFVGVSRDYRGRPVFRLRDMADPTDPVEVEADRLLIAAAPALLAACEEAARHFGWLFDHGSLTREEGPAIIALRAAVARARGG